MNKQAFIYLIITLTGLVFVTCSKNEVEEDSLNVFVFSKTSGFRHESIEVGIKTLTTLGDENGFRIYASESVHDFNQKFLEKFDVVVFLNTTENILNETQQSAFESYIKNGGGYVGIHAAADTEYDWEWFGQLNGAYFDSHPEIQQATINILNSDHISTNHFPLEISIEEEWYNYKEVKDGLSFLISVEESSYKGGNMGDFHPISWYHEFDGGRAFYTGLGHKNETFKDPNFQKHLLGGILWAAGNEDDPS